MRREDTEQGVRRAHKVEKPKQPDREKRGYVRTEGEWEREVRVRGKWKMIFNIEIGYQVRGRNEKPDLWLLKEMLMTKYYKHSSTKSQNKHTWQWWWHHKKKSIPGYPWWNAGWSWGDLWGRPEGILVAVVGVHGLAWARWDWWCTKGGRRVERDSKGGGRVHRWSWCWAPNSRRTGGRRGWCWRRPALRGWAERRIWVNETDIVIITWKILLLLLQKWRRRYRRQFYLCPFKKFTSCSYLKKDTFNMCNSYFFLVQ